MTPAPLPPSAAWRHVDAREGFECVFISRDPGGGHRLAGHTSAVEDGQPWAVSYEITVDPAWRTRSAVVRSHTASGTAQVRLDGDGAGHWRVDGAPAPHVDGCLDVDLEASACTNTLPLHRLELAAGDRAEAPAVYVRAFDLSVMRLEQQYRRLHDGPGEPGRSGAADRVRVAYDAPAFDFAAELAYDATGLVIMYPGLAQRVL